MELNVVDLVIDKYKQKPSALIAILQDIQDEVGYLPPDVLKRVAKNTALPLRQIYGVATFFKSLHLIQPGKHTITLCLGTACHVRGGGKILSEISKFIQI